MLSNLRESPPVSCALLGIELRITNEHRIRVIYGDTDMMGIVYYANYLRYFEAGRTELLRQLEISYRAFEQDGYGIPVVEASIRYRASATYDDLLLLQTTIAQIGASSLKIQYRLMRESDNTLICTGETRHACLTKAGKIARWPGMIRERLNGS
jgi:acyl-CoA thioester hydrolase